jgi:serine protease Do
MTGSTENRSKPPRGVLSARKLALIMTVSFGLGAGAYGLSPFIAGNSLVTPALAQVDQQVRQVPAPTGFADIVEHVKPAVISVRVTIGGGETNDRTARNNRNDNDDASPFPPGSPMERFFRRFGAPDGLPPGLRQGPRQPSGGQGSGFFISADGFAVTNNHVVDKATKVEIVTDDGKSYPAKVIGTDPRTDVALIKVDGRSDFPFAKLSAGTPRIGDWVLAVGNPFGLGGTVTAGIVSARGRDIGTSAYDDFIQIDAPVNRGNSGGPTFNTQGEVIGVNTAIFSPSGGNVGIAFAIPASTVQSVVTQLKDKGTVARGWIGVQIQPVTQEIADSLGLKSTDGALVAEPQTGSPAVKAGIESGDVITRVNDQPVKNARELARTIGSMPPNATVKLAVFRKGSEKTINLTLGELPNTKEANAAPDTDKNSKPDQSQTDQRLGLTLAPSASVAGAGKNGVIVTNVDPNGAGAERGVREGDVILEVASKAVNSPTEVRDAFNSARTDGKNSVLVRLRSGEQSRFIAVPVGRG